MILLVAGILGVLIFLATRTIESRVRTSAPEPHAGIVETRRGPQAAIAPAPSSDRTVALPLSGDAVSEIDEIVGWRVCVVDARTNAPVAGATVSVLDSNAIWSELAAHGIGYDTIEGLHTRRGRALEAQTGADGSVDRR